MAMNAKATEIYIEQIKQAEYCLDLAYACEQKFNDIYAEQYYKDALIAFYKAYEHAKFYDDIQQFDSQIKLTRAKELYNDFTRRQRYLKYTKQL